MLDCQLDAQSQAGCEHVLVALDLERLRCLALKHVALINDLAVGDLPTSTLYHHV